MKRLLCLAVLLTPGALQAAGGSWSADSNGRIWSQKGWVSNQPALAPPAGQVPPSATITDVAWRIDLLSPPPAGLTLQLCSARRCVTLDGLSGHANGLSGEPAGLPLQLNIWVVGKGTLYPPINVVSQQVMVNYR